MTMFKTLVMSCETPLVKTLPIPEGFNHWREFQRVLIIGLRNHLPCQKLIKKELTKK